MLIGGFVNNNAAERITTINGVTISNSRVIGNRNTGALIGYIYAPKDKYTHTNITDVTLNSIEVRYVGGRSGLLGNVGNGTKGVAGITNNNVVTFSNVVCNGCSFGIYINNGSYQKVENTKASVLFDLTGLQQSDKSMPTNTYTPVYDGADKVIFSVKTFNDNGGIYEYQILEQSDEALFIENAKQPNNSLKLKVITEISGVTINH